MKLIDLLVRDDPHRKGVPVVICDNVTEYLFAGNDQEYWDLTVDFPNLAPPFERCWMETRRPSSVLTKTGRETWARPERWGVYLEAHELADVDAETVSTNMFESLKATYEAESKKIIELLAPYGGPPRSAEEAVRLKELLPEFETQRVKDYVTLSDLMRLSPDERTAIMATAIGALRGEARWTVRADLYAEGLLGRVSVPNGVWCLDRNQPIICASFCVTRDGAFRSTNKKNGITWAFSDQGYRLPFAAQEHVGKVADQLIWPFLLAICFMHCRNVKVVEVKPDPRESERELRKFGKPLVTYRILEIDHLKATLRTEGQSETLGLKRALHICRGHFAHYTEERPLFGKKAGTFWIPQHLRGSAEAGRVEKMYSVK
jgi:hypothetical protein